MSDALSRWPYPPAMEDAGDGLHGNADGDRYDAACEKQLDEYDSVEFGVSATRSKVKQSQMWDYSGDFYDTIVKDLQAGSQIPGYSFQDGRLSFENCYCVPDILRSHILLTWHEHSHASVEKMLAGLNRKYFFHVSIGALRKECKNIVLRCVVCQAVKIVGG